MTADETELTFIRCPGCRSLVPAVAARCRMCGYQFDSDGTDKDGEEGSVQKARVRQRTGSFRQDDSEAVNIEPLPQRGVVEKPKSREGGPFRLGAESRSGEVPAAQVPKSNRSGESGPPVSVARFSEGQKTAETLAPQAVQKTVERVETSALKSPRPEAARFQAEPFRERVEQEPHKSILPEEAVAPVEPEEEFEVEASDDEVFSDGSVFPEGGEERSESRRRRRRKKKRQHAQEGPPMGGENTGMEDLKVETTDRRGDSVMQEREQYSGDSVDRVMPAAGPASTPSAAVSYGEGTLVGWLVSFAQDPKGVAVELRSGKFFVGRQRLRNSDMVLSDSSISTPHCLVSANSSDGLRIQDLMSEHGTYIRRLGDGKWLPVGEVVAVSHGDWVRFGSREMMVCLIPSGDRRGR